MRRFVRHHLVSPIAVLVKFVLLCLYRKRTSHVQIFQVRPRLCHSTFLWRLACEISQQLNSISLWESNLITFEPRLMMDEIGEGRIARDVERTSIVQLLSLSGTSKQRVLTQNVELARPVSGFYSRIAAASSGTSSSCLISNGWGVPFEHEKLSTLAHPLLYQWTGRYHTSPVDGSCFLTLSLRWIGRLHQSDPFPCPYSTE